jgi:heptosyltransferase I
MRVLLVKLSSLGDVVHTLPVVHDIRTAFPGAVVDWVVEPGFAPLVRRVQGIGEVIEAPLRRWRERWWTPKVRREFGALRARLGREPYDAIIDLQGLTKSVLVARLARGRRYGLAHATEGSSHESPARWLVDSAIELPARVHALDRGRLLAARALGYTPGPRPVFGLSAAPAPADIGTQPPMVVFIHGTSREDKLWPTEHWVALGKRVLAQGWRIALPQGNETEQTRGEMIAASLQFERAPLVEVWPAMSLDRLCDRMAQARGAIGVDSGPSHLAVALGLPHVQVYRHPTSWRTGPRPEHGHPHQVSLEGAPVPTMDAVWRAWQQVAPVPAVVTPSAAGYRPEPPNSTWPRSTSGRT